MAFSGAEASLEQNSWVACPSFGNLLQIKYVVNHPDVSDLGSTVLALEILFSPMSSKMMISPQTGVSEVCGCDHRLYVSVH